MKEKMEKTQILAFHKLSEFWPLLEGEMMEDLKRKISKQGQIDTITLYEGKILDGRNRYLACLAVGKKPRTENLEKGKDPVEFVNSKNNVRRHLTDVERAEAGLKLMSFYSEQSKQRQLAAIDQNNEKHCDSPVMVPGPERNGTTRDQVGQAVGLSGSTVDRYAKIKENGSPELLAAVKAGLGIKTASLFMKLVPDHAQQASIVVEGKKAVIAYVKAANEGDAKPRKPSNPSKPKKEEPPKPTASEDIVNPLTRLSALIDQCDPVDVQKLLFEKIGGIKTQQEFLAQHFPEHVLQATEPAKVVVQPLPFVEPCGGPEQASKQLFESFELEEQEVVFDTINALWQAAKIGRKGKRFVKPTPEQIQAYCDERQNGLSGQEIWDYYESQGWKKSNGVAVKDWQATVRTWESKRAGDTKPAQEAKPVTYPELPPRPMGISQELKDKFSKMPPVKLDD